jgi:hypothetical protein
MFNYQCSIELPDDEECDATKVDQGTEAGNTIINELLKEF